MTRYSGNSCNQEAGHQFYRHFQEFHWWIQRQSTWSFDNPKNNQNRENLYQNRGNRDNPKMLQNIRTARKTPEYGPVFYRIGTDNFHIQAYEDRIREYTGSYSGVFHAVSSSVWIFISFCLRRFRRKLYEVIWNNLDFLLQQCVLQTKD